MRTQKMLTAFAAALATALPPAVLAGPAATAATAPTGLATSTACTGAGTGTASCGLWARTGTLTLPAGASPASVPVWGYAATSTDPATAPGPVLVVTEGDQVSITLHNVDLPEETSLSLPQVDGFTSTDRSGASVGGDRTYTFTANRPGTYLYQAGAAGGADGPRQVAMGLAGALVVRPAAAPATLDGTPATAFDDEAALVLTEVDDRLNANPTGFDLRSFAPRFRLINGAAFPDTTGTGPASSQLDAAPGNRVLLRVVNAGLSEHALGGLGLRQQVIGLGSRVLAHPYDVFAETAPPGQTLDALVTLPAAPGAVYPIYETAAGSGGNTTVANFGGMLTYITTAGSGTPGGPAVTDLVATSTRTPPFPVAAGEVVTVSGAAGAGTTSAAYDVDAQPSSASPTVTPGGDGAFTLTVTAPGTTGIHTVFVRATDGTTPGPVAAVTFSVDASGPSVTGLTARPAQSNGSTAIQVSGTGDDSTAGGSAVTTATVALDGGAAQALTLNRQTPVVALTGTIPPPSGGFGEGEHNLTVVATDALGNASTPRTVTFLVDQTGPVASGVVVNPAANNGTQESRIGSGTFAVSAVITDETGGSGVGYGEGFFDTDTVRAPGTGFALLPNANATGSPLTVSVDVPLSELTALTDGTHTVYVRGRDAVGNWGQTDPNAMATGSIVIDRVRPTITGLPSITPNPTSGAATATVTVAAADDRSGVTGGEWFIGADPGAGRGNPMPLDAGTPTGTIDTAALFRGTFTVSVRVRDAAGNWSAVSTATLNVVPPNAIFADGFEGPGLPDAWSALTGANASLVTTAPQVLAGAQSLRVNVAGAGAGFVTDTRPVAEPTYHAQFVLRPTATGGNGNGTVVTIFAGRTAAGADAVAVQYRRVAAGHQVRMGAIRTGAAALFTPWRVISNNAIHTIRVDWASGPAATARLTVDGTATSLTNLNTAAFTIETAVLGRTTVTNTGGGTRSISIDSFTSTRFTLP